MKKILNKTFILLAIVVLADLLAACYKAKTIKYVYENVNLELMETGEPGDRYIAHDNDSIRFDNFYLDAHFQGRQIAVINSPKPLLINSAYANSPNEDFYVNTSRIKNISVFTVNDYNSNFPAGADITSICRFGMNEKTEANETNLAGIIERYNNYLNDLDKSTEPHIPGGMFWIKINETPYTRVPQKFAIKIEMDNGSVLEDTSFTVELY